MLNTPYWCQLGSSGHRISERLHPQKPLEGFEHTEPSLIAKRASAKYAVGNALQYRLNLFVTYCGVQARQWRIPR